ncbi:hypothetical protein JX265_006063 [Neoarthrinium moseri]|uniref:Aromatic prenyltransferase n=1 Tax=Neoarthrinium moseri TaxID=1658444 RepID=A0A9P9WMQ9_9PEZI|nr:hypothetical protein JX266_000525 [Neoarthrinium moseri]KAI1871023.1 hypothetical protein JX265_006063 [Neoarthrinium moseri]
MNAFWQRLIQYLSSIWSYFPTIVAAQARTGAFILPPRQQPSTPTRHTQKGLLLREAYSDEPKAQDIRDPPQIYWYRTAGHVLDALMQGANYSRPAHDYVMSFFKDTVAPFLGPTDQPSFKRWESFMTDDHSPIEISWDWCGSADEPVIRFSIEPIGLHGGTSVDPMNAVGPESFKRTILETLPKIHTSWFDHFDLFFNGRATQASTEESHPSRIFWGFDLKGSCITAKAYFFPGPSARSMGTSNFHTIAQAIACAPYCTPDKIQAFDKLATFADGPGTDALEFEMLAIDMVDPLESRFKIYFRDRSTRFSSVCDAITLKGQKTGVHIDRGLRSLEQLWCSLFDLSDVSEDAELQLNEHRTAGILYNAEFRLGSRYPDVKIYIPVRHYSSSDQNVMDRVEEFMDNQRQRIHLVRRSASEVPSSAYAEAMKRIL